VTNWPEYEAGLRRRGSLTLWLTPEALSKWYAPRRKTRGGQHRYSDLAIETTLTLGLVFGLRLRQAEGLLESVLQLMGLALAVPYHTTLSRRARAWRSAGKRPGNQVPPAGPLLLWWTAPAGRFTGESAVSKIPIRSVPHPSTNARKHKTSLFLFAFRWEIAPQPSRTQSRGPEARSIHRDRQF
jgi:hypothetical protein